jgi:hypothetical protein
VVTTEGEVSRLRPAIRLAMETASPPHAALARRLLDRLSPQRWTLEWRLPRWLGEPFGLADEVIDELVVSNVVGLGAIRLADDLADGEVPADDVPGATALAAALLERALMPYRAWFPADSPFWPAFDGWMAAWRLPGDEPLTGRAAPLRIAALAVCLLTRRTDASAAVDRCLDEAITGLVLADDLADWRSDLDAGRWNAFVASVVGRPQEARFRGENRRSVLVALLSGAAVRAHIRRAVDHLEAAAAIADEVGIPPVAAWCRSVADATAAQAATLTAHYQRVAETATATLLEAHVVTES